MVAGSVIQKHISSFCSIHSFFSAPLAKPDKLSKTNVRKTSTFEGKMLEGYSLLAYFKICFFMHSTHVLNLLYLITYIWRLSKVKCVYAFLQDRRLSFTLMIMMNEKLEMLQNDLD